MKIFTAALPDQEIIRITDMSRQIFVIIILPLHVKIRKYAKYRDHHPSGR